MFGKFVKKRKWGKFYLPKNWKKKSIIFWVVLLDMSKITVIIYMLWILKKRKTLWQYYTNIDTSWKKDKSI